MNLLHINQDVTVDGGGVARMIREFAPPLSENGVEVHAATAQNPDVLPEGIERHASVPGIMEDGENCDDLLALLARWDIDVVHVHEIDNIDLIHELVGQVPVVLHLHNYSYWCPGQDLFYAATEERCPLTLGWKCIPNAYHKRCNDRHPKRLYGSMKSTKKRMNLFEEDVRFVVSSSFLEDRATEAGVPAEKIDIVPYAVEASRFDGEAEPPREDLDPGFVFYAGRLAHTKGVPHLVRAMANLPTESRPELVLAGDGHARDKTEAAIATCGLEKQTELLGWCEGEELSWLYENCSMLVVPSVWDEVFGIVGLEAMAAKRPVVAYDVGGISQWLVDGETGHLVPPKEEEELSAAIQKLLENPEQAERMGRRGYERFREHFTVQEQAQTLKAVYENTIKN
jgi:glycosyltransferase involved in cell wall biosynthesis